MNVVPAKLYEEHPLFPTLGFIFFPNVPSHVLPIPERMTEEWLVYSMQRVDRNSRQLKIEI